MYYLNKLDLSFCFEYFAYYFKNTIKSSYKFLKACIVLHILYNESYDIFTLFNAIKPNIYTKVKPILCTLQTLQI